MPGGRAVARGDPAHASSAPSPDQPAGLGRVQVLALNRVIDSLVTTCTASGANGCGLSRVTESPETKRDRDAEVVGDQGVDAALPDLAPR